MRVASEAIRNIWYDRKTETLKVEFRARGTYEYYDVPLDVGVEMLHAASKGIRFNNEIKDVYSYARVG